MGKGTVFLLILKYAINIWITLFIINVINALNAIEAITDATSLRPLAFTVSTASTASTASITSRFMEHNIPHGFPEVTKIGKKGMFVERV